MIFFFFNDTATTEIYTLSLHDALPISEILREKADYYKYAPPMFDRIQNILSSKRRSEEHTSELQSQSNLVCRLLLEKKKKDRNPHHAISVRVCDQPFVIAEQVTTCDHD